MIRKLLTFALTIAVLSGAAQTMHAADPLVFISAFAPGDKGAIHAYRLDVATGRLREVHRTTDPENPFFMALSPDRKFLYATHARQFSGSDDEQVAAYEIVGDDGQLKLLNRQSSRGRATCYVEVDATRKAVLVANYTSGSVTSLPVRKDGSLGEPASFFEHRDPGIAPSKRKATHAHCTVVSPDNRFVYAADLAIDQVVSYRLEPTTAKLSPNQQPFVRTPRGAGPRHLTFHPNGKDVYVINETANSITSFSYESKTGVLIERQTIATVPEDFDGTSHTADLKITPDGRFLYGTNRGHDSIAAYRIGADGRLTLLEIEPSLGKGPQNLAITSGGELLLCANMPGGNVVVFRIDSRTGRLSSAGEPLTVTMPSCIMIR